MTHTYPIDDFERHMVQSVYWQTLANRLRQSAKTRNPLAIEALIFDAERNATVHSDLASQCRPDDLLTHQQQLRDARDSAASDAIRDAVRAIRSRYPSRAATYAQR